MCRHAKKRTVVWRPSKPRFEVTKFWAFFGLFVGFSALLVFIPGHRAAPVHKALTPSHYDLFTHTHKPYARLSFWRQTHPTLQGAARYAKRRGFRLARQVLLFPEAGHPQEYAVFPPRGTDPLLFLWVAHGQVRKVVTISSVAFGKSLFAEHRGFAGAVRALSHDLGRPALSQRIPRQRATWQLPNGILALEGAAPRISSRAPFPGLWRSAVCHTLTHCDGLARLWRRHAHETLTFAKNDFRAGITP